jgi:hypothetical protein
MTERLSRFWARRRPRRRSPEPDSARRLERLEARVEHLEAELEGLQDAVYHRALEEDEKFDDLRRRTAPDRLARDLSEDARRRGL